MAVTVATKREGGKGAPKPKRAKKISDEVCPE